MVNFKSIKIRDLGVDLRFLWWLLKYVYVVWLLRFKKIRVFDNWNWGLQKYCSIVLLIFKVSERYDNKNI